MAMQLDLTTVYRTKCKAVLGATVTDVTTKMVQYQRTVEGTAASVARKDISTRIWLDLPHT